MELELDKEEVRQVVLDWANVKFPGMFNEVTIDRYTGGYCRLTKEEPKKEEA